LTDAVAPAPAPAAPPVTKARPRWLRLAAIGVASVLGLCIALLLLDTSIGHRFIVEQIAELRPANGLRYSVGRIKGSIYRRATLVNVAVSDRKGLVLAVPVAQLDWQPLAWLGNRLDIRSLAIPRARLERLPELIKTKRKSPILPGFDIHVGTLRVDRLALGAAVTGKPRSGRLKGRADIRHGRALIDLTAVIEGSDRVQMKVDAAPDQDRFDIDAHIVAAAQGLIARLTGLKHAMALTVSGDGSWHDWHGTAIGDVGRDRVIDLKLGNRSGNYALSGHVSAAGLASGAGARLTAGGMVVNGHASLVDRVLDGRVTLVSSAIAVETQGAIDFANNAYRDIRTQARLRNPAALLPTMTGSNIELRAIIDGGFDTAAFDYRLTADRVAFDRKNAFEIVRSAGHGHLSKSVVMVPITLGVARVTGVGPEAGGILRNFVLNGALRIDAGKMTGDNLRFKSDKLSGALTLALDFRTGIYQVVLNGALGRYLIPDFGIVDVTSTLHVVPGPGGKGARIIGTGVAQVVRLDNEFFRSLAGGLPRLTTALEQSNDGIMHFSNVVLTGPAIRIVGSGYRRPDGSLVFNGTGAQHTYGPLALKLDGRIERPMIDLVLASPSATLGLTAVHLHLAPSVDGFTFHTSGGSRLGEFTGNGQILLPRGDIATIRIAELDVRGIKASGALRAVNGGLDGTVNVTQGGISGVLLFNPVQRMQRVEAHLAADNAVLVGDMRLRRGKIDLVALIDPDATALDADFRLGGLHQGKLWLSRLVGTVKLRGGSGQIVATLTGTRGRGFDIKTVTDVTPDRYTIAASGTIDRRDARLAGPAVITQDDDGWRLGETRLLFSGGEAAISGRFTSRSSAIDATLTRLPLSMLDLVYPDLGLDGAASGKLNFAQGGGQAPTGKIDMTVRGLSRAGLTLTSKPIDLGLVGILQPDTAALRAVMASDGKTIGRAQARLAPLPQGTLTARLANAPLFAQLRYDGPADTLWRLTGIESFDLSGPVAIGADIGGKLNDPRIKGAMRANGARIESATTGTVLTNVQAAGQFSGSKLVITSFGADAGKGGRVGGSGTFDFAAVNGFGMDLSIQADNAVIINRDDIAATVTGPLAVKSDGSGGLISGNVRLDRSRYRLGQAAAATAVPKLNMREINQPDDDQEDAPPSKPWRMDVTAKAARGLSVTGLGLTSEWSADLHIAGLPDNPAIDGRADLVRGTYEFAGREFALERGMIRFGGEAPVNPALDIQANADASGLSASIRVSGPALKPLISFTSTPALPEDELLSRLLFGTSITNLSAPEALQLASAVSALQNGGNGLNPINVVRRAVGLDRLRILPADATVGRTTSVAAGKYVTRRLYAEIITDGQGYSATQVEYQVTRWLSLLSTVSTLGRSSANVRVSKDY
jgi:translocation and assembly module TamB